MRRAAALVYDYLCGQGLEVRYFDRGKYPAILAGLPNALQAPVMLSGHFDVVSPDPDESQFDTRIEGDYLWGRGAADMKTVVATNLVWLKDMLRAGAPYPPVNLLLVGNEENGEAEPMGTPHVLNLLKEESGYVPRLLIAGERTGEKGNELWGEICIKNRGVMRFDLVLRGQKGHSGVASAQGDLTERLISARSALAEILRRHLTLSSPDKWQSQMTFPFIQVGTQGVYNITADKAVMGVEVRLIPEDNLGSLLEEIQTFCESQSIEFLVSVKEAGISCDPENPYLLNLIRAVREVSKEEPRIGKKLPGTSARFAPLGQGVVWGQTGIGPHAKDERHYIPSILPYYQALLRYGEILKGK